VAFPTDNDPVVTDPTYMGYIRHCFTADDVEHMKHKGMDLGTYGGVKGLATNIYLQTLQPGGTMPKDNTPPPPAPPPPPRLRWSANRSLNFKTWIQNNYPLGTAIVQPAVALLAGAVVPSRVRKNVNALLSPEITALTAAFNGIIALDTSDPTNPNSYFNQAAIHGLPRAKCVHHQDPYNPWHRVFITGFENALRSIKGCEDVTLPYWDITEPVPALFATAPFNSYTVTTALGTPIPPPPYVTSRYSDADIAAAVINRKIPKQIQSAVDQSMWGQSETSGFQNYIIAAHDNAHVSVGPTMAVQEVAAYDPIFWFFHCNWERLFKSWQTNAGALDLKGFTSTLAGNTGFLDFPPLDPWMDVTSGQTIEQDDVGYDQLAAATPPAAGGPHLLEHRIGSMDAALSFTIALSAQVSVLVKDINRLNIPGSFEVYLLADGVPVASQAFFQPTDPNRCENCKQNGLVSIRLLADQKALMGKKLTVKIEVPGHAAIGTEFPLSQAGNPTINARLLLEEK
jgi:tyrosinase